METLTARGVEIDTEKPISSVALLSTRRIGEIEEGILSSLKETGVQTVDLVNSVDNLENYDRTVFPNPMYSNITLIEGIQTLVKPSPVRVWNSEQYPHYPLPKSGMKMLANARYQAERLLGKENIPGGRLRMLGEMFQLAESGIDFKLSVYSEVNRRFFEEMGIDAQRVPPGYFKELGHDLGIPMEQRTTDVVFLGSTKGNRREKIVRELQYEFSKRKVGEKEICFEVYDIENLGHGLVYGNERTNILNNSKIMLSLARDPHDDHIFRHFLAGANRTALIAEKTSSDDTDAIKPFLEGEDLVMEDIVHIPDRVQNLLTDIDEINRLADNLHKMVMSLPTTDMVQEVIR
ncbi:MAG TPA: hypothetical protein PLD54_03340 [Candidatus Levybacteria bacterium]|nr:hypothetical protein [Candidatus Levybacteria bacterium]